MKWNAIVDELLLQLPLEPISEPAKQIASLLDYTLLNLDASPAELAGFYSKAGQFPIAAICVYPKHLPARWDQPNIKKATVVNFPSGQLSADLVADEIEEAIRSGADEIDYVFPWQDWQAGHQQAALTHCQQAINHCRQQGKTSKIILESGGFHDLDDLYQLSRSVIDLQCDFLKTSTGKIAQGCSPAAAITLLQAIKDSQQPTGIKFSGGIRSLPQATLYIRLATALLQRQPSAEWLRIGASSLIDSL